jgi:hypothetical protein
VDLPVFAGVFGKNGHFLVVFWWCKRGGLRGKRGVLAVSFWGCKNAPGFGDLFLIVPFLGRWMGWGCYSFLASLSRALW